MSCNCDYILAKEAVEEQHYFDCPTRLLPGAPRRNPDGTIRLNNKHLNALTSDYLYHFDFGSDRASEFQDVKFVCMGGKDSRMLEFTKYIAGVLNVEIPAEPVNLAKTGGRFVMYKIGPVLSLSHGMGIPSMSIALQEAIKLMYYAKAKDPIFIRLGSSGGLTIPGGSVVISSWGLSGTLEKTYDIPVMGKMKRIPSILDKRFAQELLSLTKGVDKDFNTYIAGTMGTDDFYRGQARLDGPFCDYEEQDKMNFLKTLAKMGVKNIEMEATAFAAMTSEAGVRSAILCATFLDRLEGDQVTTPKEILHQWENRPMMVLGRLIKKYCENIKSLIANNKI